MPPYHDHTKADEASAPTVDRLEVTRVIFRRGVGCCEQSPIRWVTAYYDTDGSLIAEVDSLTWEPQS